MAQEIDELRREADEAHRLVIRLLDCLWTVTQDHPDLELPDTLAGIPERYWRHVC
jgi:hypothetical protein